MRYKLASLLSSLAATSLLLGCSAVPVCPAPLPKAEAPVELLQPPSLEAMKALYETLGLPWLPPDEKQK